MSVQFADDGIIRMRFEPRTAVTRQDARGLLDAIDARVPAPRPLRVLVDGRHGAGLTLMARLDFVDWIRRNISRYHAAVHDVPPVMMATATHISALVGGRLHVCRDQAEAVRWLGRHAPAAVAADGGTIRL